MKSNNTHNIRQGKDNSCAVMSAILAYKAREAVISVLTERLLLSDAHWTEQMQRKVYARWSRAAAEVQTIRDSLSKKLLYLSLVAFWGEKIARGVKKKKLSWQHCAHLNYSPLSLWLQRDAFSDAHTRTGISGPRPIRGGGGGPPFTISDWFRPRYGQCV